MEEKKFKHYSNLSLLVFIGLILIGCLLSLLVYQMLYVQTYIDINIYVFDIIVLIVGYLVSVSLYYLGKYLLGLLSGYHLVSFNFWGINFVVNKDNKIIVRQGKLQGLGCRVNMAPSRENPNYKLFLFGGTIFSLPLFLVALIVYILLPQELDLKYYLLFIFSFIPFICIGNLIPVRLDSYNDGFILRLIHSSKSCELFHRNLKQFEALVNGRSKLEYYEYKNPTTPFELDGIYYNYYYLIDNKEYTRALRMCEVLIKFNDEICDLSKVYLGYSGKIYEYCRQKRFEESDRYFWELKRDIRSVVRNKNNFESIKICLYVAAYMETNYDEYLNLYYKKDKLSKKYEYLARIDEEVNIINETIKEIQMDHKDWYVE
ncbi:MAG: hypothetical protein SOW55_06660 [Bacilli bacterium]|nr:hypothetical protein [Bacilli bacterium]